MVATRRKGGYEPAEVFDGSDDVQLSSRRQLKHDIVTFAFPTHLSCRKRISITDGHSHRPIHTHAQRTPSLADCHSMSPNKFAKSQMKINSNFAFTCRWMNPDHSCILQCICLNQLHPHGTDSEEFRHYFGLCSI